MNGDRNSSSCAHEGDPTWRTTNADGNDVPALGKKRKPTITKDRLKPQDGEQLRTLAYHSYAGDLHGVPTGKHGGKAYTTDITGLTKAAVYMAAVNNDEALFSKMLERIRKAKFPPSLRMMIPKGPGSGLRPIDIPSHIKRLAALKALDTLEPLIEARLSPGQYGCRSDRYIVKVCHRKGATTYDHMATLARKWMLDGYHWVVQMDLKDAFGLVPHFAIELELKACGLTKDAIDYVLKLGRLDSVHRSVGGSGKYIYRVGRGVEQGNPISAFLLNLALSRILRRMDGMPDVKTMAYVDDIYIFTKSQPMALTAFDRFQELGTSFRFKGIRDLDDGTRKIAKPSKLINTRKKDGLTILKTNTVTMNGIGLTDDKINHPNLKLPEAVKELVDTKGRYVSCDDVRRLAGAWSLSDHWILMQDWFPIDQNQRKEKHTSSSVSSQGQPTSVLRAGSVVDRTSHPRGSCSKGILTDITGAKPTGLSDGPSVLTDACLVPNGRDVSSVNESKGPTPMVHHTGSSSTEAGPHGSDDVTSVVVSKGVTGTGDSKADDANSGVAEPSRHSRRSPGTMGKPLSSVPGGRRSSVSQTRSSSEGVTSIELTSDGVGTVPSSATAVHSSRDSERDPTPDIQLSHRIFKVTSLHPWALSIGGKAILFDNLLKGKIPDFSGASTLLPATYDEDVIFHLVNGYLRAARINRTVVVIYDPSESWTRCQSVLGQSDDSDYKVVHRESVGPLLKLTLRLKRKRRRQRRRDTRRHVAEPPVIAQQVIWPPRHSPTRQFKWTVPIQGDDGTINHGVRIPAGSTRYGQLDAIFWGVQHHKDKIVAVPALPLVSRILEALQADRRRRANDPKSKDDGHLPNRFPAEALALHWARHHEWHRHGDWWVGISK